MNATAYSLTPDRNHSGLVNFQSITKEETKYFTSVGTVMNLIGGLITSKPATMKTGLVSSTWIDSQKQKHKDELAGETGVDFVSTNDLLTSMYFRTIKADVGLMVINFRNRIDGLTSDLAGNYENMIGYQPPDYSAPHLIRKSLSNYRRSVTISEPLCPGFIRRTRASIGIITNWANVYHHIEFTDAAHIVHTPLFRPAKFPLHICACSI